MKPDSHIFNNTPIPHLNDLLADGVMTLAPDLRILAFNHAAERIMGYREEEVLNRRCSEIFQSEACTEEKCPAMQALKNRKPSVHECYTVRTKEGQTIPLYINAVPTFDDQGHILHIVQTFRNLLEMKDVFMNMRRMIHESQREHKQLKAILSSIADGVFTVDEQFRVTSLNQAGERITGYKEEEILGKECAAIFRSTLCKGECPVRNVLEGREIIARCECTILNRNHEVIPVSVSAALLRTADGKLMGAVETFQDLSLIQHLSNELQEKYAFGNIIGKTPGMQEVYSLITDVAPTDANVLICGETGTGKDLAARAIHYNSPRREKPFISVNCAALAETLLESELFGQVKGAYTNAIRDREGRIGKAEGGTLFLDEIAELAPRLQAKLLKFLEKREYERVGESISRKADVRIVAATNKKLAELVESGEFRSDLFYRLSVVAIHLPPLRNRVEDIPLLVDHFLQRFCDEKKSSPKTLTTEALNALLDYPWPGNVRQLENVLSYATIRCTGKRVLSQHFPPELQTGGKPILQPYEKNRFSLAETEKQVIEAALKEYNGNRRAAADALNMSRASLWRRMKKFRLL
ncbi:MAG: PAS domain-containing protein [Candidatus Omnitrophota bacterium]|jgi:PAS domain S-box-containing protein|nr:MAG: PAS domain-containing protein [Candidatus Omnitrophota bacterium]